MLWMNVARNDGVVSGKVVPLLTKNDFATDDMVIGSIPESLRGRSGRRQLPCRADGDGKI